MAGATLIDLSVGEIMTRWPATIGVFIDLELHCIGCPISPFHTLVEAAEEHGLAVETLTDAIEGEIARSGTTDSPASGRRRSAAIGAHRR
ncbi:MAG: DUF1858 domain-containing protein [Devosia nanyangense]|uniref:DUF1858 domain-containing protein n=1 Tax=Devosia nanyangense TaxID=1228055 RepID=A0A933L387_9HYPH|nr:DUF1858 domain-containing protein [Devosia nanyangense]